MATFTLATYLCARGPRAGAVVDGQVFDVADLTGVPRYADVLGVLTDWDAAHEAIADAAASPVCAGQALELTTLAAPVPHPGAVYCIGRNYRDHAEEMRVAGNRAPAPDPRAAGEEPFFFLKSSHCVAGPGVTVNMTGYTQRPDSELELVVVIGRTSRDLTPESALGAVAGYTIGNDLSARDRSARPGVPVESLFRADWLRHKSFDDSAPMGPWMTPSSSIADPGDLQMRLWVNDALRQDSNTGNMIYTAAEQIAALSSAMTLHPGDLIMTGTPAGVGAGRGEFLQAGDRVRMAIESLGEMSFTVA